MNQRTQMIMEIRDSFYNYMIQFDEENVFEFDNPEFVKNLMLIFIANKAEGLSDNELLTAFGDRNKILDEWMAFLKTRMEMLGNPVH
ncbi:MAG: hypothetical protein JW882_15145 [Deltaproteobacteria bacterium]|nr:hypothetical protein [Deltaproteobacteria bacterium]